MRILETRRPAGVLLGLALVFLLVAPVGAVKFTVSKVITVGPCGGGVIPPVNWSNDGGRFAYCNDSDLYVSDTLGNTRRITTIDGAPRKVVWSSDSTLMVFSFKKAIGGQFSRLEVIDVTSGVCTPLESFVRGRQPDGSPEPLQFTDVGRTVNGTAYYRRRDRQGTTVLSVSASRPNRSESSTDFFLCPGRDAVYKVPLSGADSTRLTDRPYHSYMDLNPIQLNRDQTRLLAGGWLVNLPDGSALNVDSLPIVRDNPPGAIHCGTMYHTLNPVYPEVAFFITCDISDTETANRAVLFAYADTTTVEVDSLIGLKECVPLAFSPDGRLLTINSGGVLYVVARQMD